MTDFRSPRLVQLFHLGAIEKSKERLKWFEDAFDHAEVMDAKDGWCIWLTALVIFNSSSCTIDLIRLHRGYDDVLDTAVEHREELQERLEQVRAKHEKELKWVHFGF